MNFHQLNIHIIIYHMPPRPGLPNSKETWKRASEASEKSERKENTSASKIEEWQFLKLRVLWRIPRVPGRAILRLFENEGGRPLGIFQNELEHAREELSCVRPWRAYIKYLEERPERGGVLWAARRSRCFCASRKTSAGGRQIEEQGRE